MQVFFIIAFLVTGLVQLFAIADGINYLIGIGSFLSHATAIFITYVPLLGQIAGVYGAVKVWDWSIWQAGDLYFWPILVFPVLFLVDYLEKDR